MTELLPCPFCGLAPRVIEDTQGHDFQVFCICEADPCFSVPKEDRERAILAWNTRTAPAKGEAELEALADQEHTRWSKWMVYLFSRGIEQADGSLFLPAIWVKRWKLQVMTHYADLSEAEKESDRVEAREVLSLLAPTPGADRVREALAEIDRVIGDGEKGTDTDWQVMEVRSILAALAQKESDRG